MADSKIDPKAKTIEIKSKSRRQFLFFHGFTGSPTDFNLLGNYLNKRFSANVKIIRLKGHGEKIENLDKLHYLDFYLQCEEELLKAIHEKKEIILGGISIGALIALDLASRYKVNGVILISAPLKFKFPVGIISFLEPVIIKKHWYKPIPDYEKDLRKNSFFYDINIRGFRVIKEGKKSLRKRWKRIDSPCLIIHVGIDKVFHKKTANEVYNKINSTEKEIMIFDPSNGSSHNPFFSPHHKKLYSIIGDFVEEKKLFK